MDPVKVGEFIKNLRKNNNLTQAQLAKKYGVTYQAVSKWENGLNIPDISLLKQISKDFNVSIENILEGNYDIKEEKKNKKKYWFLLGFLVIILIVIVIILIINKNSDTFHFKTLSTSCEEFKVSGSIAYNKEKSSIYISNINYCGGTDDTKYKEIQCNLYETNGNTNTKISSCVSSQEHTLEDYLKEVELNIDNYGQVCRDYTNNSLYLEIEAIDQSNKTTTYKIPLKLNENCSK